MLELEALPVLKDNYVWILHDNRSALIVDPGEAAPILTWLATHGITPVAGLITHHHGDHCAGLADLPASIPFYGPALAEYAGRITPVADGDSVPIPALGIRFEVIATPGHTLDHLCYYGDGYLFCGDCLFSCGCGRLFEGTPAQMLGGLDRLGHLPDDVQVCPAHEYTLANLAFALDLEPDHPALLTWQKKALALRRRELPTLPVRLGDERLRNPFMRCREAALQERTGMAALPPENRVLETFAALRTLKDTFHA